MVTTWHFGDVCLISLTNLAGAICAIDPGTLAAASKRRNRPSGGVEKPGT